MIRNGILSAATKEHPDARPAVEDAITVGTAFFHRPMAAFLSKFEPNLDPPTANSRLIMAGGLIANLGDDAEKTWALIAKYQNLLGPALKQVTIDGKTWFQLKPAPDAPELTWGLQGQYVIVGMGSGEVEGILARMKEQPPKWLTAVRNRLPVGRRSMFLFVNARAIVEMIADKGVAKADTVIKALGLDRLTAIASTSGLDGDGYVGKSLLGVRGEPAGIFDILNQKPLTAQDLAPLPKDALMAMAFRMDLASAWQKGLQIASAIDPRAADEFKEKLGGMETQIGLKLEDDLLKPLGDVWCLSSAPPSGFPPVASYLVVVSVRDAKRLSATHEKLLALAAALMAAGPDGKPRPKINRIERNGRTIFALALPQLSGLTGPCWSLTEKELVIAPTPNVIEAYLGRPEGSGSLADAPEVAGALRGDHPPFMLTYQNSPVLAQYALLGLNLVLRMTSGDLKKSGIDVDASLIPPPNAIVPHLRPIVCAAAWSKVGLQMASSRTFPGESMTAVGPIMPIMVALLLPAVQAARGRAALAVDE